MDKEKSIQGFSLYVEYQKSVSSDDTRYVQVLVIPTGYDESGNLVPQSVMWRVVSNSAPKKQWKLLHSVSTHTSSGSFDEFAKDLSRGNMMNRLWESRWVLQPFTWAKSNSYSLVKSVILETSKKDMTDVRASKTPTKLIYRLNQSRTAVGLSDIGVK
jgi:hypothetical protein